VNVRTVFLDEFEIDALDREDPDTESDGGWQGLLIRLQLKVDRSSGCLHLDARDLEQIFRYAFEYGNGGWEDRLKSVFERTLGPGLGQ
jgi:hypothetical protein